MTLFLGESGTTFEAILERVVSPCKSEPLKLTDATVVFLFQAPSGTVSQVTAEVTSASKGVAKYTLTAGFLDEVGVWRWQVRVTTAEGTWYAPIEDFSVSAHL